VLRKTEVLVKTGYGDKQSKFLWEILMKRFIFDDNHELRKFKYSHYRSKEIVGIHTWKLVNWVAFSPWPALKFVKSGGL
jgi:hypothetical protein